MNTVINAPIPLTPYVPGSTDSKRSDVGFLIALFVLVLLQFLLFYFGVPKFADSFVESDTIKPIQALDSHIT